MKLLGITGGVGMGKSTAQQLLQLRGVRLVDTDQLARAVVEPGQPALAEVVAAFGRQYLAPDGTLERADLARLVFEDAAARTRLEAILHPRIRAAWQTEVERWRQDGVRLGAVVIPLLFETEAAPAFDATVCVACSSAAQQERLQARGWTAREIQQRIAAQWPIEKKMAASDFVVWTDGDLAIHAAQWDRILPRVG
jgi:dephospho-CoA kinase